MFAGLQGVVSVFAGRSDDFKVGALVACPCAQNVSDMSYKQGGNYLHIGTLDFYEVKVLRQGRVSPKSDARDMVSSITPDLKLGPVFLIVLVTLAELPNI